MRAVQRPLSDMERAFWLLDRGHSFNGVQVVSLRGPLSEPLLTAALRRLQQRHPPLRMRVAAATSGEQRRLILTDESATPIPLRIMPRHSDNDWQAVVKEELNQRFAANSDHLTRAVWVRGPDKSELVFGVQHIVCDALSIMFAMRDLLSELSALASGEAQPAVESLPLRPPLPALLPRTARGWRRLFHMQSFFYKHVLLRPLRRTEKLPCEQAAPPDARRSGFCHRSLSAALTHKLTEAARREGTTVHAALCAALLLAVSEVAFSAETRHKRRRVLGCSSAVNLRHELTPPIGEEMGLYISQVTTFHRTVPAPPLWALARELKAQLQRTLAHGEQYLTMPLIGLFIPRGPHPAPRFIERFDGGSPAAVAVTNIGRLPIPLSYGPFVLENCQFAVSPSVVSPLIVTASTCDSSLNLNLVHIEPLCGAAQARAILDATCARLVD
jgi:hypothetical protein